MSTSTTHIKTEKRSTERSRSKLVPELRFKEFDDALSTLGFSEVGKILIGLTHKPEYVKTGRPFLSSKNISGGFIDFENIKFISEEEFQSMPESTKPKKGDILFTRVGSNLGNPIVFNEDKEFAIFVSLGVFRVNEKASNHYIKTWMDSNYFWRQLEEKVAGGAKNNLNTGWLKEFKLNLPTVPEQQKIAFFLNAVGEKIQQLTKKKELLEQYKKGVMQQLFSGQLRFKDENGKDYPDWEEKRLGEIVTISSGISPSSYELKEEGSIPFLKVEELNNCSKYQFNSRFYTEKGRNIVPKGSVVFPKRGAAILNNKVRITAVDAFMDSNLMSLQVDKDNDNEFLYYFLIKKQLFKIADTSTIPQINNKHIEPYQIRVPSLSEQQNIATYLSSIDTKIESVKIQITQTQTFKKGLLQQMFV